MAKVALLIGVSEYEPGLNPLPAAVRDVEAMREVLLHEQMGGFTEDDITVLKNPNRQVMEEEIETLFMGRQKDDLVFLFFSGHGIKDDTGRLFLATRKTRKSRRGDLIRSTAVSSNFVQESMSRSRSKRQVVVLDSCFSGAFAEGLSAKDDGSIDIRTQLGGEGRAVLTSSSSTQYSFEQEGEDLSLYTRHLVEGIRTGEADADEDEFISIDELHAYANRKVRESQPQMKPEIYGIREGLKIRLAKVAPGEPSQRYRKEVSRYVDRGDISLVGRHTLDILRTRLELTAAEAAAIEDEVLGVCRKEFQEKRGQYEQVFAELLKQGTEIAERERKDLQSLQQMLGLRNEDTLPIEEEVRNRLKTHRANLSRYEQAFSDSLRQHYPMKESTRQHFAQMRQSLGLSEAETKPIESQIFAEVEEYYTSLKSYEEAFVAATHKEYPLGDGLKAELKQRQQQLGLADADVAPVAAKVKEQIESYQRKLKQYEAAWVKVTQRKVLPNGETLRKFQRSAESWGLKEADVKKVEAEIRAQIEDHQVNLVEYEKRFAEVVKEEYPLSTQKLGELNLLKSSLNLEDVDVRVIETRLSTCIEEHRKKLEQYAQVFSQSVQYEYPLSKTTQIELKRLGMLLNIESKDIKKLESKILENCSFKERSDSQSSSISFSEFLPSDRKNIVESCQAFSLDERPAVAPIASETVGKLNEKSTGNSNSKRRKISSQFNKNKWFLFGSLWVFSISLSEGLIVLQGIQSIPLIPHALLLKSVSQYICLNHMSSRFLKKRILKSHAWPLLTTISGALGDSIHSRFLSSILGLNNSIFYVLGSLSYCLIVGGSIGVSQWTLIQDRIDKSYLWIFAVILGLLARIMFSLIDSSYPNVFFSLIALGAVESLVQIFFLSFMIVRGGYSDAPYVKAMKKREKAKY